MELRDEPARSNCVNTAVASKSSVGWRPMLLKLSNDISECLAHAADARERANAGTDPALKANLLDMELRWQRLVESYRFVEQASRFLEDSHLARMPSPEKLPQTGVLVVTCPTTGKDFSTGILTDRASLTLTPQELTRSHCPHCDVEHSWRTKDAKLVEALPPSKWVEFARAEAVKADAQRDKHLTFPAGFNHASVSSLLDVLVRTVIEKGKGEARAAFYVADGAKLHHVTGMPEAYARCVDGFAISPQSLACGLAAATGQPIITPDVAEEPLWKPWVWLATQFDYRACWSFPVRLRQEKSLALSRCISRSHAKQQKSELDFAATITRAAAVAMSRPRSTVQ